MTSSRSYQIISGEVTIALQYKVTSHTSFLIIAKKRQSIANFRTPDCRKSRLPAWQWALLSLSWGFPPSRLPCAQVVRQPEVLRILTWEQTSLDDDRTWINRRIWTNLAAALLPSRGVKILLPVLQPSLPIIEGYLDDIYYWWST